ncbi:hypothetical protein SDC9_98680 [bioreactor metagenome]|uniref:Uncharacterized protein n=1 Tax=bioreactor metagenome TaxID=1076179 RepID=A0A645AGV3_9ZZZZ
MRVLVPVDIADHLHRAGHEVVSAEVIKKHKPAVEINTLEDIVRDDGAHEVLRRALPIKVVVRVADERIAPEQEFVVLPLIEHLVAPLRLADGIQHIAVTLAVDRLLIGLNREAEIHLVGRDIFADGGEVRGLDAIQKDQEREDLVIGAALRRGQVRIILHVRGKVDLLRDPEVIHRLPVEVVRPAIFEVVEVVEVGRVTGDHAALVQVGASVRIKQRFLFENLFHRNLCSHSCDSNR